MIVTDLSQSFHPVPKESGRKDKRKAESSRIKQKSSKLAKLERNRFSIITKDLEHCYICTKKGMKNIPKDDLHELLEGKNRQVSMKYGLVIPICRKCHNLVTNDKTLQDKLHKVAQKEFKNTIKQKTLYKYLDKVIYKKY